MGIINPAGINLDDCIEAIQYSMKVTSKLFCSIKLNARLDIHHHTETQIS